MNENENNYFSRAAELFQELAENPPPGLDRLVEAIFDTWERDGTVICAGNGGSAADSEHFTTELVARFNEEPIHKPALSLSSNSPTVTAVGNDWSYEEVFSRQLKAHLDQKDLFLGISTSGTSTNVLRAVGEALKRGADCFALTGANGGDLTSKDCVVVRVPARKTCHIQEAHAACLHYVCREIDRELN